MNQNETEFANQDEEISKGMDYKDLWDSLREDAKEDLEIKRDRLERYLHENNYDEVIMLAGVLKGIEAVIDTMDWLEECQRKEKGND